MAIRYARGDATHLAPTPGTKIVAHICNDVGAWGAGFVQAVSRRWPQPEAAYRAWGHRSLGNIQLVRVEQDPNVWVANMVAQHGIGRNRSGVPPIRYAALERCLRTLTPIADEEGASVHMPRIGCGLAGGSWDQIEPIITRTLVAAGLSVTVYDL